VDLTSSQWETTGATAVKAFLKIGALAGAAAGLALAVFLWLVGEPAIQDAIRLERARAAAATAEATGTAAAQHTEMFSRGVQQIGGGAGALVYGISMGLVFAVVLVAVRHRLVARDDWRRAVQLAAAGFVTIFLVPFCKYPANPPAVGDPDTITRRTVLYLIVLAWSCIATWAGWRLLRFLRSERHLADPAAVPAALAVWALLVAVAFTGVPGTPDRIPSDVPATLLWRFRLATLGGAALFWTVLGLAAGALLARAAASRSPQQQEFADPALN
jgi:predicted cobalt transporter CbtA